MSGLLKRSLLALAVSLGGLAIHVETDHANEDQSCTFCVYGSSCTIENINTLCNAACPGNTGGMCGDNGSCGPGGFNLYCARNDA